MKYTRNLKDSHCVIKKPLLLISTYLKRLALRNEFGKWVKKRCTEVFGQSSDNRCKTSKNKLIFFHTQSAEGCLKEEIDILCFLLNKKNIADALLFYFWFAVDAEWEKMGRIVAFHEKEFNNKIVPQNKLTPEKVQDFRRQIQRLKTHLVMRRRTESSVLMIQQKLNKLFLDLIEAGSICGMGQIIVPSSMLMTEWFFSKNQKIKFWNQIFDLFFLIKISMTFRHMTTICVWIHSGRKTIIRLEKQLVGIIAIHSVDWHLW